MTDNPDTTSKDQGGSKSKDSLPEEEFPRRDEMPLWWPNMEESRGILADYVGQFEVPPGTDTELPEDPDSGAED